MSDTILVINAGSSSIKFYLYDIDASHQLAPRLARARGALTDGSAARKLREFAAATTRRRPVTA